MVLVNDKSRPGYNLDDYRWFSWGVASLPEGSVFGAVMCKIQASKRNIKSLPLVLKDKKLLLSR